MSLPEDLAQLETQLASLISRYEKYFIGLEKREPLQLLNEVDRLVRRYAGTTINNTMYKHKFNTLVGRLSTYREHWNRTLRLIEEGKYSRDRFISDLHQRNRQNAKQTVREEPAATPSKDSELDRVYNELCEARKACNLPTAKLSREQVAATLEKSRQSLADRFGSDNLAFRVVIEEGKPKIKASLRK